MTALRRQPASVRRSRRRKVLAALAGAPLAWAAGRGVAFDVRAAAARRRGEPLFDGVPAPTPSLRAAASVAVDSLSFGLLRVSTAGRGVAEYRRATDEVADAIHWYGARGWLDDPTGYHRPPPALEEWDLRPAGSRRGLLVEELTFASGWEPEPGEPGAERWLGYGRHATAVARVLRHPGPPRPWLVAIHGFTMGRAADVWALGADTFHRELGINVALPVLPLHGPRRLGRGRYPFISWSQLQNNVLGFSQAMWEIRRLLRWVRDDQAAPAVGVFGVSLGAFTASLLTTLEGDLACVVAAIGGGDLAAGLRPNLPLSPAARGAHRVLHGRPSDLVHRLTSALAAPCRVPRDRRFLIAGSGDPWVPPHLPAELWRHWEEPTIAWVGGGHATALLTADARRFLRRALRQSGLAASADGRAGPGPGPVLDD